MNQYKFYKITYKEPIYIGCTTQKLNKRLWQHFNDNNSSVYQEYIAKGIVDLSIERIYLTHTDKFHMTKSMALYIEEILTYIYGTKYILCNYNAGNRLFDKVNDDKLYSHIMFLLQNLIDGYIKIDEMHQKEILQIIADVFETNDIDINNLFDCCCEKIYSY